MWLIGVDGCRAGWVTARCVVPEGASALTEPIFSIERSFRALLEGLQGQRALVAVDIPIGLPHGGAPHGGRRRADRAARELLRSPRSSSVFSAPCRDTLAATSYRHACELERAARGSGKGISRQTYGIISKIREVDDTVTPDHQVPLDDAGAGVWVREVHPEVTFARLSPGQHGLKHPKRGCTACRNTPCADADERLDLLRRYLPSFDPTRERASLLRAYRDAARGMDLPAVKGVPVGRDDVIDAVACLVSALRITKGQATTLPAGPPERDARGLRMEIVA